MVRLAIFVFPCLFFLQSSLIAQPDPDPRIARALAVQKAISEARDYLQAKRPAQAVAVLEAEIMYVNGNEKFLAVMKDAYIAYLKDLKRANGDAARLEHASRQLAILDPKLNLKEFLASGDAAVSPGAPAPAETAAAQPGSTPPLVPQLKSNEIPTSTEATPAGPAPVKPSSPPAANAPIAHTSADDEDPFNQPPLDRQALTDLKAKARAAFEKKRYPEAAALFAQAQRAKLKLTDNEIQAWAYSRLSVVAARLNGGENGATLAEMRKEAEDAALLGGPTLEKFGAEVVAAIRKRQSGADANSAIPEGWQAIESGSFRVFVQQTKPRAEEVSQAAERARMAAFGKWYGPAGADWSPRCDIWLHANANDYAKSTNKPASSAGHSSVGFKDGQAQARRIDLRLDDASLIETTLAREVSYVVLADLFPDQPLPHWADVGMTILAEPPAEVARYSRALPRLIQEKKIFSARDFLKMAEFPDAEKITAFYIESVSLVDYMVRLKGAKAFTLYLREAPRRGYEEALQRHYGIKDAAELQEMWIKFAMKSE
jgi:hypothetical protein